MDYKIVKDFKHYLTCNLYFLNLHFKKILEATLNKYFLEEKKILSI